MSNKNKTINYPRTRTTDEMISLTYVLGQQGASWASVKNRIRSGFKNGRMLSRKQMSHLKRVHEGEIAPGGVARPKKQKTQNKSLLLSEVVNVSDHLVAPEVNVTDTPALWDTLEVMLLDVIGVDRRVDLDHNDFALLRDISDVAIQSGNVPVYSPEYGKAISELLQRVRQSHI